MVMEGDSNKRRANGPAPRDIKDLINAFDEGDLTRAKECLEAGCDPASMSFKQQNNALICAVVGGKTDVARLLLESGVDPGSFSPEGDDDYMLSPLIAALEQMFTTHGTYGWRHRGMDDPSVTAMLLVSYCDTNAVISQNGMTPLHALVDCLSFKDDDNKESPCFFLRHGRDGQTHSKGHFEHECPNG